MSIESTFHSIDEGLIKTYPAQKFKDWFIRQISKILPEKILKLQAYRFGAGRNLGIDPSIPLVDNVIYDVSPDDKPNTPNLDSGGVCGTLSFLVPVPERYAEDLKAKIVDLIDNKGYVYGYTVAGIELLKSLKASDTVHCLGVLRVQVEAKFTTFECGLASTLFHVTLTQNLARIARQGLVPKSKSDVFTYPERVYLFNHISFNTMMSYAVHKAMSTRSTSFSILKIRGEHIVNDPLYKAGKLKFFVDPMFFPEKGSKIPAVFTYEVIPSRMIDNECVVQDAGEAPRIVQFKD